VRYIVRVSNGGSGSEERMNRRIVGWALLAFVVVCTSQASAQTANVSGFVRDEA